MNAELKEKDMTTQETENYLQTINSKKQEVRKELIKQRRIVNLIEQVYFRSKEKHSSLVQEYQKLDREYALEKHRLDSKELRKSQNQKKAYNPAKRLLNKALKQLENLPPEMREKILKDLTQGAF